MCYIVRMREVNLRRVDLNLLAVLEALLDERNVTRAAERLGMSQPAASRALARLRGLFGDPLLVDGRSGYLLSARAEQIRPTLARTLAGIDDMIRATPFDPAGATGSLRLMMPDLTAASLAPRLIARLGAEAPGLDLDLQPPNASLIELLESDAVDLAVGVFDDAPAGIRRRALFEDRFLTMMRTGHPAAKRRLTLSRYLEMGHIVVSVTGVGPTPIDTALARIGRRRRVPVRVPNFLAAVEIAAQSDLIMTLPQSLSRTAAGMDRLVTLPPPIALARFTMSLLWHSRRQDEPQHAWLRRMVVEAANEP